jgi:PAS domain S-box-containing protein
MTDYSKYSREKLLSRIRELENLSEAFLEEKEKEELLKFSWTGNLGHWYWDFPSNKVTFNPLKVMALGYSREEVPEEVTYQFFTDKLHPDDYERVMEEMRQHLKGEREVWEVEYRIQTKQGEWKHFHDRGKVTKRDEQGRPLFLSGIVFDITQKKETEKELEEKNRKLNEEIHNRDKFFSIISHDLKKSFQHLIGFPELLLMNYDSYSNEKIKEMIDIVRKDAENTYTLLENLFEWSQAKRGAMTFEPVHFNLPELTESSLELLRPLARSKELEMTHTIPDISVYGDKNMLYSVLRNLVHNAIKFSQPQGKVEVSARFTGDLLTVSVRDNGTGMPEEIREHLFHMESDVSRTGTTGEKGSGLGLILCKEFVEKHGGQIWVEETSEKGTTFSFSIPQSPLTNTK